MTKQDQLRAILRDIQSVKGLTWLEAKKYACGLLPIDEKPLAIATINKWLTREGQDIPDNKLELLRFKWGAEKEQN